MSALADAFRASPLRTKTTGGRSGKFLVAVGLLVLTLGMFTDSLGRRVGVGGWERSVLEIGMVLVALAVGYAFLTYLLAKLKRGMLYGVFGGIGFGLGVPALGMVAALGALPRSLGSTVHGALPWVETTRWERLLAAVGGPRGLASSCYGTVLLTAGAATDSLGEEYVVFGHHLSLLTVFLVLTAPGVVSYYVRR